MGKVSATTVGGLLLLAMLVAPVTSGHTQQTLTVILTDEGVVAGNITDPAFVQGNALWFRMEDSTNNTSMMVRVDVNMDGEFSPSEDFESPTLTNSCELDENGSLVDDTCAVSSTYAFDLNATVGTYMFWVHRSHNGSETVWNHSIAVHKDVHEEDGPSPVTASVQVAKLKRTPRWRARKKRRRSSSTKHWSGSWPWYRFSPCWPSLHPSAGIATNRTKPRPSIINSDAFIPQ